MAWDYLRAAMAPARAIGASAHESELRVDYPNGGQVRLYGADYDDKLRALRPHPVHDWTSHAADSFRYLAMTLDGRAAQSGFHRRIDYARSGSTW